MNKTNRNIFSTKVLFSIGGWTAAHQIKKMLTVKILEVENKVVLSGIPSLVIAT